MYVNINWHPYEPAQIGMHVCDIKFWIIFETLSDVNVCRKFILYICTQPFETQINNKIATRIMHTLLQVVR